MRSWATQFIQFENHIVSKSWKYARGSKIFFLHIEHSILILPSACWCFLNAQSLLEFQNMFLVRVYFQLSSLFLCFQGVFCSLQTSRNDQHLVNDFQVSMSPSTHSLWAYKTNSDAISRTVTSTRLNILGKMGSLGSKVHAWFCCFPGCWKNSHGVVKAINECMCSSLSSQ